MTKTQIIVVLSRCAEMVSVERNLTPQQIEFAAEYIVENCWIYSLEDLQVCFDRGCMGKYGELYNRLDPSVIMGWLNKYEQERNIVIAEQRKKDVQTNNIYDVLSSQVVIDAIRQAADKLSIKEAKAKQEPERPKPSPFEQQVIDEWGKLERNSNYPNIRKYIGFHVDFTAYRKMRYNELIEQHNTEDHE